MHRKKNFHRLDKKINKEPKFQLVPRYERNTEIENSSRGGGVGEKKKNWDEEKNARWDGTEV